MPDIDVVELPELDTSLLPYYQEWKAEQQTDRRHGLWYYLFDLANHEIAAAFSKLFWPDFIEVDGLILLAENYPRLGMTPEEFKQTLESNPRSIEFTVNYVSIPYMFRDNGITMEDGVYKAVFSQQLFDYLARVLLISWKHALKEAYPDKEFVFFYNVDPDGANRKISFYQRP
ncbi:MAG: hypothetical protein M3437_16230 [Chloroflexota bacterium]|nr:hypothetical protein [Chloroflexota bacterium]MDQ5865235.1 hypothetical protein [Chloroflexota bacterium]